MPKLCWGVSTVTKNVTRDSNIAMSTVAKIAVRHEWQKSVVEVYVKGGWVCIRFLVGEPGYYIARAFPQLGSVFIKGNQSFLFHPRTYLSIYTPMKVYKQKVTDWLLKVLFQVRQGQRTRAFFRGFCKLACYFSELPCHNSRTAIL